MRVELFPPDSEIEPRHWVRHDQAFAMMLRPGSIEWGSKRSALEKFSYAAGDLALCDRHVGEWVGLMNVQHLQLGISDAALMASSDGAYGEVELHASRKFSDSRLSALVAAAHAEMVAGFPSGRLFLDSIEQAMAIALVNGHAVRHRPVQVYKGGLGSARLRVGAGTVRVASAGSLGDTAPARLTGAAGSIAPDDRGVKHGRRAGSQATARGVAPDDAPWGGTCYSPGLRADHRLSGALCLWQADRQLCRADPL